MQFYRKSVYVSCVIIQHAGSVVFTMLPACVFFEKSFRVPKNRLRLIIRAHWRDKTIVSKVSGFLV